MSDSLWPHGVQHARLPCPSSSGFCSNSPSWSRDVVSSISPLLRPSSPALSLSNELAFHNRWPKFWSLSFSISPSNEYSGLISFKIDRFDLLAVQGTIKSLLPNHNSKNINSSVLSLLYGSILTSIHDYWKNYSFDYMDLCWKSDVFSP